jgi:molecular chaperone HtpG
LQDAVEAVSAGTRLVHSPAAALHPDEAPSPQMRELMKALHPEKKLDPLKVVLEINPRHDLIKRLAAARETDPARAKLVAHQILDTALLSAGILEDPADLVKRGYEIMAQALAGC